MTLPIDVAREDPIPRTELEPEITPIICSPFIPVIDAEPVTDPIPVNSEAPVDITTDDPIEEAIDVEVD